MKGALQLFLLPAVLFLSPADRHAAAQEPYHHFANKDGITIEAKIVSVTPDWQMMKILKRDGKEFEMPVNVLSLDDQQIVKEWIRANPGGPKIDYNLDVEIEKKSKTVKNERGGSYKYKTMDVSYEITVNNRTRQDLRGGRVDYVVILKNGVTFGRDSSGLLDYYSSSFLGEDGGMKYLRKSEKLADPLSFNRDHTVLTEAVQHEEVFGDGNVSYGEDKVLGVILRVIGANEEVIGEYRSSEAYVQKVSWDQVKGNGFADAAEDSAAPETGVGRALPDWLEVRELDSLPELLQKGDTIEPGDLPRWAQKPVRIKALVDVDEDNSGGTIVACGGENRGFSLFVLNDTLHFWVRRVGENDMPIRRGVEVSLSEIPATRFQVAAEFKPDSIRMWIDDKLVAEGDSFGLLTYMPEEGLSVGYDSGQQSVGGAPPPHAFRGTINDVRVEFGGSSFD